MTEAQLAETHPTKEAEGRTARVLTRESCDSVVIQAREIAFRQLGLGKSACVRVHLDSSLTKLVGERESL